MDRSETILPDTVMSLASSEAKINYWATYFQRSILFISFKRGASDEQMLAEMGVLDTGTQTAQEDSFLFATANILNRNFSCYLLVLLFVTEGISLG